MSTPDEGALCINALIVSMVYHMGRLANPDINPEPGNTADIRRDDGMRFYVARYFTIVRMRSARADGGASISRP